MNSRAQGAFGDSIAEAFRLDRPATIVSRALHKSTLAVTEVRSDKPNLGLTAPLPREDAYLVGLQLRACPDHDLYFDGRATQPRNWVAGVTTIFDLRQQPVADIRDPAHSLMFYLPRTALSAIAAEAGAQPIDELRYPRALGIHDPVTLQLLSSVRPAIEHPEQAHPLFLDHVVLAIASHVACTYGGIVARKPPPRGGLAAWQLKRVTELMTASLGGVAPGLDRLAAECGLSARHFARAFRRSTGEPPHRWLSRYRVRRAKELLRTELALAEVALRCGFADQSHFTRAFRQEVGLSPGQWRRSL